MRTHVSETHVLVVLEPEDGDEDIYDLVHPLICEPEALTLGDSDEEEYVEEHICAWSYVLENETLDTYFVFPGDATATAGRQMLPPGIYPTVMKITTERNYWGEVEEDINIVILPPETTHEV